MLIVGKQAVQVFVVGSEDAGNLEKLTCMVLNKLLALLQ
jgi:hypothetical protein